MSFLRKIKRAKEKESEKEVRKLYGKKPKEVCPVCHKKSLFMTNDKGEVFCLRCDARVK